MSRLVPENMTEIKQKEHRLRKSGRNFNESRLIIRTVLQLFQIYLDNAEEGHYDTAQLTKNGQIEVKNTNNQVTNLVKSQHAGFVKDFKNNSLLLRIRLEERADRIAELNS